MKTTKTPILLPAAALAALLLLAGTACRDYFRQSRTGTLLITLRDPFPASTRAGEPLPDVGSFCLTVTDAAGKVWYDGSYERAPDELTVPAGAYTVSAVSAAFDAPAYDAPQWGDTQVVSVAADAEVAVALSCTQLNCGLRLAVDDSFRKAFSGGSLRLSGAGGSLDHPYDEQRTAFFLPGTVAVELDEGGYRQTLFARTLEPRQILSIRLCANVGTRSGGISLQLDTARTWLSETFTPGGAGAGDIAQAYDVPTARTRAGEKGVWVAGYIVGVATNTGKIAFDPPFTKNTNLVLGTKASTTDKDRCLSVELRAGELRDALNLQDHPDLLGRKVYIKGDLVSAYYGIPGLKAPTEYQFNN